MTDLFAAIDETNDGEFLAFVICDIISLIRNHSILPKGFTHMTEVYPRSHRRHIINNLDLTGVVLAYCVKFDLPKVREILSNTKLPRQPHFKVQRKVSYRMVSAVNKMYSRFLLKRGLHIQDLTFEVDNRMVSSFLRDGGLKCNKPNNAHKIADCLAYANLKNWKVKGNVKEWQDDFRDKFIADLKGDFRPKK